MSSIQFPKLGIWQHSDGKGGVHSADRIEDIAAQKGRFAVVQGTVLSVRESRGVIYVNFSRRWSHGFAASILKRNQRALGRAGIEPKQLEGHVVRVRGYVEGVSGPRIEVSRPEQVEVVQAN